MTRRRDYLGYAGKPPHARWPGGARIALQFVINYEEGAERSIEFGDAGAEHLNSDNVGATGATGVRDYVTESHYDYGSRVGYWRLMDIFDSRNLPATVFAVGAALERNEAVAAHLAAGAHEVCGHGWRWIEHRDMPETEERADMARTIEAIERLTGKRSTGWYTGRISVNTRRLAATHQGLLYDSDAYDDDLPYWVEEGGRPWLVVPYTFECNDMRFASAPGFNTPEQFFTQLKESFDVLYEEGATRPKMMSVGLHCRLAGRPSRAGVVARFADYALQHPDVWVCRRSDIAEHWYREFSPRENSAAMVTSG
jgi:putative urate catabolism protein